MQKTISGAETELIKDAVRRNQLTGCGRFVDEIEKKLGRRVELRGRGRPKK
jgi:putative transposase